MDYGKESLRKHRKWKGKLSILPKMELRSKHDLSLAYTPGVAAPCLEIARDPAQSYELTGRGNLVAVVTDGSAVLGLGDIGPEAGMPVMEGKCVLFRSFAGIDAFPLCIRSNDVDTIVDTVSLLAGSFGGINLEDIAAPRCFEIEEKLKARLDIPVFHDDQHGTAIVTLAAVLNACKLTGRELKAAKIVISGAGAAGTAIARLLARAGATDMIVCDRNGALDPSNDQLDRVKREIAQNTNPRKIKGSLADCMVDADVFIGVSAPGIVTGEMVGVMAKDPILFPMANPIPEIFPQEAKKAGAAIIGTGRSDFPNQINNVLAFPGVFRGALDARAKDITEEMNLAAAYALADLIPTKELEAENILPEPFDLRVAPAVAKAVAKAVRQEG